MEASKQTYPTIASPRCPKTTETREIFLDLKSNLITMIETLKEEMNNSLKELQENTIKQMKETYKTVQDLKMETGAIRKTGGNPGEGKHGREQEQQT